MTDLRYDKEDLQEALRVLRNGGIIVYPTDTVWGIGCDATNAEAVAKETAWALLEASEDAETKPLTLIYPHARNMAPNLIAEDGSIGIRISKEPFSKALCAQLKHPIVSTSANISGHPTAHFYAEIEQAILDGADYVCRFRREDDCPAEPSSIIQLLADGSFKILRP